MEITAKLRYLRMAPRKLRLVADLLRGQSVAQAKTNLRFLKKAAARPWAKLLASALANAKNQFQLDERNLYLAKVLVDEGPKLKRWRARARGRAFPIQKKTAHLTLALKEVEAAGQVKGEAKRMIKKPAKLRGRKAREKRIAAKLKSRPEKETAAVKQIIGARRIFRRKAF